MKGKLISILGIFVVIITVISVSEVASFAISNTLINWIVSVLFLFLLIRIKKIYYVKSNNVELKFINIYLFWLVICIVRGVYEAEYYWDFKTLINSSFSLLLVYSAFVFTEPLIVRNTFKMWIKYALPLFLILVFFIETVGFGYYLIPLSIMTLFFVGLSLSYRILIFGFALLVVLSDFDARSNIIKFIVPFLLLSFYYFKELRKKVVYRIFLLIFFAVPFVLFFLAATNIFNVFRIDNYVSGNYTELKKIDGELQEVNLKADTRTFLYYEVISSALKNEYVLFGRTPARGNDSYTFGTHTAEELGTGRYERYGNEVSVLNIFTWTGLVGLLLYFMLFLKAALLAVEKSNNTYVKVIGIYVAFRWSYAWVEDFNRFDIMNVMLWLVIGMCYSNKFRQMNDKQFVIWIRSLWDWKSEYKLRKVIN